MVRDIIDIDSTYEDFESSNSEDEEKPKKNNKIKVEEKENNKSEKEEAESNVEEDEFNISLAKMEEEIKPKILNILRSLNKNYTKLQKYQRENLSAFLTQRIFLFKK